MSSPAHAKPGPGRLPDWQVQIDYGMLHALVEKIGQQMDAVGLDVPLLRYMQTITVARPSSAESSDECMPSIDGGFRVSEMGFAFESYFGVDISGDIRTETDSDIQKSKARQVYRSLVIKKQSFALLAQEVNSREAAEQLRSSASGMGDWVREMDVVQLPRIERRLCKRCQFKTVEVPVTHGTPLFAAIAAHALALRILQDQQVHIMEERMASFSRDLGRVTAPSRLSGKKSDLGVWREVLKLFHNARILAAEPRSESSSKEPLSPVQRLMELQSQISKTRLPKDLTLEPSLKSNRFRHRESGPLLMRLIEIFTNSLQLQTFLIYHQEAITHVLERFDCSTGMKIQSPFLRFLRWNCNSRNIHPFTSVVSSLFESKILPAIPQLEDYSCVICTGLAFKPVRLECGHVFCIRCVVRLQRQRHCHCPMCRQDTLLKADSYNIDYELMRFLEAFFPSEAKCKQRQNEREVAAECRSRFRISG